MRRHLPSPEVLSAEQRIGDPETYRSYVLHTEPDGASSVRRYSDLPMLAA